MWQQRVALYKFFGSVFRQGKITMTLFDRRRFGLAFAASASWGSFPFAASAAEPPPEVTTIRLPPSSAVCLAPLYIAEPLLKAEGFTEVKIVQPEEGVSPWQQTSDGAVDFDETTTSGLIGALDDGFDVVALAGGHAGCLELFVHDDIATISDLKGKRIAIQSFDGGIFKYFVSVAAYVGLDPREDFEWVTDGKGRALEEFAAGRADAFLAFAPEPQELRARNVGRVILDTALDRPWSQHFCCHFLANRAWVERHPIATKRALRAFLKASDICESQPVAVANELVRRGFYQDRDLAIQALNEIPYGVWRDFDSEDSMRFFALRMYDAGLLKNRPNSLISAGADWRFIDEIKRELKA